MKQLKEEIIRLKELRNVNNNHSTLKLQLDAIKLTVEAVKDYVRPDTLADKNAQEWYEIEKLLGVK